MFGYEEEELVGKNVNILMPDDYAREHDQYMKNYLKSGEKKVIGFWREVIALHKNGMIFPILLNVSEIWVNNKRWFTGIIHDMTEQTKVLKELKEAKEESELASKAKSEFLASMSHEIRTPMNAVLGFTDLLADEITEPRHKQFIDTIKSSGKSLVNIINDILQISKIEAGKWMSSSPQPT